MKWLLAVDLRVDSQGVVEKAGAMAERAGATIDLVYVDAFGNVSLGSVDPALQRRLRAELGAQHGRDRDELQKLLDRLPESLRGAVDVLSGGPEDKIIKIAEDYDLLLVGAGKTGFQRLLLGSICQRLVRTSPVPVMVLR